MHKITKGLKKKKKGKKHKKEDDLFDQAELEKYRREHQQDSAEGQPQEQKDQEGADNEEWKRFKALTAGVDSVLKKTEEDLNRIKSTSYFQRKPPGASTSETAPSQPGESKQSTTASSEQPKDKTTKTWVGFEEGSLDINVPAPEESGQEEGAAQPSVDELLDTNPPAKPIGEEEEEEEEEETEEEFADDDIFDTSYIDVVKLAYIPDSPTQEEEEFDPFDTSIAEKVIKEEEEQRKSKKNIISLGCAVEVLTGRLETTPTLPGARRKSSPRRSQQVDLLLDEDTNVDNEILTVEEPVQTLLDDKTEPSLLDDIPILNENTEVSIPIAKTDYPLNLIGEGEEGKENLTESKDDVKNLVAEFDLISDAIIPSTVPINTGVLIAASSVIENQVLKTEVAEDDLEDEFAALAAESISKKPLESQEDTIDPFDTIATVTILQEKVSRPDTFEIDTTNQKTGSQFPISPDVDIVLASEPKSNEDWTAFEEKSDVTTEPSFITPVPLQETLTKQELSGDVNAFDEDAQVDPFDTSFAENILPGKAELKIIENEILSIVEPALSQTKITSVIEDDFDFDPRKDEIKPVVEIDDTKNELPEPGLLTVKHRDLLGGSTTQLNQDPLQPLEKEEPQEIIDPFDTSVVDIIVAPGKAELKFIEKELLGEIEGSIKRSISDPDFDPRATEDKPQQVERPQVVESSVAEPEVPDLLNVKLSIPKIVEFDLPTPSARPDLLVVGAEEEARISKPLTPFYVESKTNDFFDAVNGSINEDPFDTSFAENLAPGKAELKIIESELVGETSGLKHSLSDQDFNPRGEENQNDTNSAKKPLAQGRRFSDFTGDRRRAPPNTLNIKGVVITPVPLEVIPAEVTPSLKPDLLAVEENAPVTAKPLTPAIEAKSELEIIYTDPFDTSIANNLVPGRAELKVLESELVKEADNPGLQVSTSLPRSYTDPDFNPRDDEVKPVLESPLEKPDLLNLPSEEIPDTKTLTPQPHKDESKSDFDGEDIDPFDTSIVAGLLPGKAELKVLESEFIGQ